MHKPQKHGGILRGNGRWSLVGTALIAVLLNALVDMVQADVLGNWTTNQLTTNSVGLKHIVYGNGLYVATGELFDGGDIYSSEDGFHWTLRFSDLNSWGLSLNYSSGHFCGVSGWGFAAVSADGTNWTSAPTFSPGPANPNYQSITYGNGQYVTAGDTNGVASILRSADGITWNPGIILPAPGGRIGCVVYGAGKFVAIGNNDGLEYSSTSGFSWAKGSIPGGNTISYANGLFFVPLNNRTNLVSEDGIAWDTKATGLTNTVGAVTYSHGLFMALCGIPELTGHLATSIDGTNWVEYASPLPHLPNGAFGWQDVSLATDGSRLVAVNCTGTINFNSYIYVSDPLVGLELTDGLPPGIVLSGLIGRSYQIQSADSLAAGPNNWRTNVTLQLPATPFFWTDATVPNSQRFYRAVLLP